MFLLQRLERCEWGPNPRLSPFRWYGVRGACSETNPVAIREGNACDESTEFGRGLWWSRSPWLYRFLHKINEMDLTGLFPYSTGLELFLK